MDTSIARNGSGYFDPTALAGIQGRAKPGEIWMHTNGRGMLIIKNHGAVSTVLTLLEVEMTGCMEIISRQRRFTNPAYISFVKNSELGSFVQCLPEKYFAEVLESVACALGFKIDRKEADAYEAKLQEEHAHCDDLEKALAESENKCLEYQAEITALQRREQQTLSAVTWEALYNNLLDKVLGR